jgi:hypothetical protein
MTGSEAGWEQEIRDRQQFRSQMVRGFAFTVMDHGVALTRCPECDALASINSAFPDSDWNSLSHLLSVLETYLESTGCTVECSQCQHEFVLNPANESSEYWLWHAHFLPESKRDLQLLVHRRGGRTRWVEGMLIDENDVIVPMSIPVSEPEFRSRAGCYFSVRQAWREFLQESWPVSSFASLKISDGYYLVLNPPLDSESDLTAFKDSCVKLVSNSTGSGEHYEFADLSWADSWNFEEDTYHQWLPEFEKDLEESGLIAGVLASPEHFYNIVQKELHGFGCWLRREGQNGSIAFLGDDEYYLGFNYREYLVNAMIKGYSYWGALRFIEPMLDSWEQARDTGERLKRLLASYHCTVYGGHYFQCRATSGKRIVREFDLLALEPTDEELENDSEFLKWIAPQISLNPETLKFQR